MDTLNIYAYDWSQQESYGRVARELADGLEELGCYVNRIGPNAPQDRPLRMALGGIALGYPTLVNKLGGLFAAGTQVWITAFESDALPFLWADILNQSADAVIVPSEFCRQVFQQSGVEAPVHSIPQGVSAAFQYVERQRKPDDPYTFIAIADRGGRKAWDKAGFAFVEAFGDDMHYKLILKTRENALPFTFANPNIESVQGDLDDAGMAALYAQADCFLSPGREGFGLGGREFARTGGIALALDWGGTADDLHKWGLPIATQGMERAWKGDGKLDGVGQWAAVHVGDMAQTMQHVARNRAYYARWARSASAFVTETYDWSIYAQQVYSVWQEACRGKRTLRTAV